MELKNSWYKEIKFLRVGKNKNNVFKLSDKIKLTQSTTNLTIPYK